MTHPITHSLIPALQLTFHPPTSPTLVTHLSPPTLLNPPFTPPLLLLSPPPPSSLSFPPSQSPLTTHLHPHLLSPPPPLSTHLHPPLNPPLSTHLHPHLLSRSAISLGIGACRGNPPTRLEKPNRQFANPNRQGRKRVRSQHGGCVEIWDHAGVTEAIAAGGGIVCEEGCTDRQGDQSDDSRYCW